MIFRGLGILAVSLILTACDSSGSKSDSTGSSEVFTPQTQSIEKIKIVDALNKPLTEADAVFTPTSASTLQGDNSCTVNVEENASTGTTDSQGSLDLVGLVPGDYQVFICKEGERVSLKLTIASENAASTSIIAVPLTVDTEGSVSELPEGAYIIVAISGVIYSDDGVVENAQVALSGGTLTNGAMATAITDKNGFYSVVINMNIANLAALQNTTVQVVAEGFDAINITGKNFTLSSAFSGVNIKLTDAKESILSTVYEESFEISYSDAICGQWTAEILESEEGPVGPVEMEDSDALLQEGLWHAHESGLNITNQAYLQNLVSLAPNDLSQGKVPNPIEGSKACWYGKTKLDGSIEEGNFLNEEGGNTGELNGGTSIRSNSGAIVSPRIDLSAEAAPLALTFKTWWEIEAVNPNENGFDLMSVEYKIEGTDDGEGEWITIARLNPLTDPVVDLDLSPLPYSNLGFNQAPAWLTQEPISLDNLAGKVFQLRFSFSTVDGLFNGFRGWLVDDVKVINEVGTFPLWEEFDDSYLEYVPETLM
jgi:hypothetical protein